MSASVRTDFRKPAIAGLAMIAVLAGIGLAWSAVAKISSAVVATGTVGVSGKPKTIQHLDGGIIEKINVEAGMEVREGDVLAEIDDRAMLANLTIYRSRLREALVRKERLLAELSGKVEFGPPDATANARHKLEGIEASMDQQRAVMAARMAARSGETAQLSERIAQFKKQIEGASSLKASKQKQLEVYGQERQAIETLVNKAIAARQQLLTFDRAAADLNGQIAEHDAEIGRLENAISEVEISKLQVDKKFREEAIAELDQVETSINELVQQVEATGQQLERAIIRAPVNGIVHELQVFTIGGVIQPGQAIMQIVPLTDRREVEVQVDITQIDQVGLGQKAVIRFPSFHQRTTPELIGQISRIAPASVTDEKTGYSFYRVGITIPETELAKLSGQTLIPGMPVEAILPTGERTVLAYLIKPLTDNLQHVFREE